MAKRQAKAYDRDQHDAICEVFGLVAGEKGPTASERVKTLIDLNNELFRVMAEAESKPKPLKAWALAVQSYRDVVRVLLRD